MTQADRRINELIDKWLASIDLHLKYVELSDLAYSCVQPWPKHDRPTRWVLEVARQKVLELKEHCGSRQAMGDAKFAESLELMLFLANLVGIQHIQRFIPLADPNAAAGNSQTVEQPTVISPAVSNAQRAAQASSEDPTREMPRLVPTLVTPVAAKPAPAPAAAVAAAKEPVQAPAQVQRRPPPQDAPRSNLPADLKNKIMADAIRLLKWGKPWHELAELIARIADRPSAAEIRKFLRANKADIEERAAQS